MTEIECKGWAGQTGDSYVWGSEMESSFSPEGCHIYEPLLQVMYNRDTYNDGSYIDRTPVCKSNLFLYFTAVNSPETLLFYIFQRFAVRLAFISLFWHSIHWGYVHIYPSVGRTKNFCKC